MITSLVLASFMLFQTNTVPSVGYMDVYLGDKPSEWSSDTTKRLNDAKFGKAKFGGREYVQVWVTARDGADLCCSVDLISKEVCVIEVRPTGKLLTGGMTSVQWVERQYAELKETYKNRLATEKESKFQIATLNDGEGDARVVIIKSELVDAFLGKTKQ